MFKRFCLGLSSLALVAALPAGAATWTIDTGHSSAVFKIKHFSVSNFYGMFNDLSGTLEYDAAKPAGSSIDLTIRADSVDSRNSQRDGHITSPDFLNAKQFPTITFKSKSVKETKNGLEITGDLTLLGISEEIRVEAVKTGQGINPRNQKEIVGFEARFSVDRTAFDMSYMEGPLSKEIEFILAIEAVKQ